MDNGITRLDLHASAAYGPGVYALALVLALVPIGAVAFAAAYVVSRVRGAIAARGAAARLLAAHRGQYAQVERTLARANSVLAATAGYAPATLPAAASTAARTPRTPRTLRKRARAYRGSPARRTRP